MRIKENSLNIYIATNWGRCSFHNFRFGESMAYRSWGTHPGHDQRGNSPWHIIIKTYARYIKSVNFKYYQERKKRTPNKPSSQKKRDKVISNSKPFLALTLTTSSLNSLIRSWSLTGLKGKIQLYCCQSIHITGKNIQKLKVKV